MIALTQHASPWFSKFPVLCIYHDFFSFCSQASISFQWPGCSICSISGTWSVSWPGMARRKSSGAGAAEIMCWNIDDQRLQSTSTPKAIAEGFIQLFLLRKVKYDHVCNALVKKKKIHSQVTTLRCIRFIWKEYSRAKAVKVNETLAISFINEGGAAVRLQVNIDWKACS